MSQCVGLMGRLFGHQFVKHTITTTYKWHICFRCGRKAG